MEDKMTLRFLAACEQSGRVRDAFAARGWDAWSCDLEPSDTPGQHVQGDVLTLFEMIHDGAFTLIVGFPPCFTAGTPVITARGVLPIEKVGVGDRVLTHKGRWRMVTNRMTRQARVITDGQITATPDHPFWTRRKTPTRYGPSRPPSGGAALPFELAPPDWTRAADTGGMFLGIPAAADELPVPGLAGVVKTTAFWYMVGRWLGDGWTRIDGDKHYDTIICCARAEAADLAAALAETGLRWRRSEERTVARFTLSDKHLCRWLEAEFGKYAHGKTLPGWLFGAPEGVRRSVLHGYLDADGCRQRGGSPGLISSTSSVSRNLAVGVRVLATTLGYTTTLTKNSRAGHAVIEGRPVVQRDSWTVVIRKDDGRFTRTDDLHRWVKQRRQWRDAGVQTVYDITVDEDHSFIAHGFAVHNCDHLSQAGAVWWKAKQADGRQATAAAFFMRMVNAPAAHVAVENPRGIMTRLHRPPDQVVQPWWFGDPFRKATCLWLRGLPLLVADRPVEPTGRIATGGGNWRTDQANGRLRTSAYEDGEGRANRAKVRGRTLISTARAMASQWGAYLEARAAA